jgi:predicted amidohydrolase YtcJ
VNSKALELLSFTKDTPNPEGGAIDRDAHGNPTGILRENAVDIVREVY